MVKLRAFIIGTVMHLYWAYPWGRSYASIDNIYEFLKNSHFALFGSFGIHAKDTNFTFGTPWTHTHIQIHTDTCTYTDTDTDTIFTFCTFWLIWHTCQRYLAYHRFTHAQTLRHMYRDIDTYRYTETHTCLYTSRNTHADVHVWNLRKLFNC